MDRVKTSVGIWAFGPTATRFMPGGYHAEVVEETMEERTERAARGVGPLVDGFDLFPYTEDQAEAVRRSVLHGEFICDLACRIDDEAPASARARKDALAAYREVYRAMGLDEDYGQRIIDRYRS